MNSATAVNQKVGLEASSRDVCWCLYTLAPPTPVVCIHLISMSVGSEGGDSTGSECEQLS